MLQSTTHLPPNGRGMLSDVVDEYQGVHLPRHGQIGSLVPQASRCFHAAHQFGDGLASSERSPMRSIGPEASARPSSSRSKRRYLSEDLPELRTKILLTITKPERMPRQLGHWVQLSAGSRFQSAVFLRATITPSRVGFTNASKSGSSKINRLCSRMASVQPGTMSTGFSTATLPCQRTLSAI